VVVRKMLLPPNERHITKYMAYGDTMAGAGLGAGVNKSTESVVDGAASTTTRQRSWSDALTTPLRSLVAAASLFSASEEQLKGGIIPDGADDALFRARGAQYAGPITATGGGAVALKIYWPDQNSPTGRSGFWTSGAIYDQWNVITAAHNLMNLPDNFSVEVVVGPNFRTNVISTHKVSRWVKNPAFTDKQTSRSTEFDLAVLNVSFDTPIKDSLPAKLSTTPLPAGELVMMAGGGHTGTPSTTYTTRQDGFFRAGTSLLDNDPIPFESREFYRRAFFQPTVRPGDIRGAGGDSGGPVFRLNSQGRVVSLAGLMVSGSIDITGRSTGILDLSNPKVQAFIRANVAKPDLTITDSDNWLSVSWSQTSDFVLQTSFNPDGVWNNYTNTITTNEGVSRVVVSYPAKESYQFFRLVRK
jgi:hypothetical protein